MNRYSRLMGILILSLLALNVAGTAAQGPAPQAAPITSTFNYQGRIIKDGVPITSTCAIEFKLFDASTGGNQIGTTQTHGSVTVKAGLFTVALNFGDSAFTGDQRYLQVAFKCSGDANWTTMSPRQPLTAVPYALSLRPGATISSSNTTAVLAGSLFGPIGVIGTSDKGIGIWGNSQTDSGVLGTSQVGDGVLGQASNYGSGVHGKNTNGGVGVYGETNGMAPSTGVYGVSHASQTGIGVYGLADGHGTGVIGANDTNTGVFGWTKTGAGVRGYADEGGHGVEGISQTGYAGYFNGNVQVNGSLTKGGGAFKIDHPLDPANKYLYHSFVESPDMKNIYDGVVTLDTNGVAVVQLPDWFEALNQEFRYQLTPIGAPGPSLYIAEEIQGNHFKIAGGAPGMKVSWLVTGVRHDAYANAHRIPVEEDKPPQERSKYLYPKEAGQPEAQGVNYQRLQQLEETLRLADRDPR